MRGQWTCPLAGIHVDDCRSDAPLKKYRGYRWNCGVLKVVKKNADYGHAPDALTNVSKCM